MLAEPKSVSLQCSRCRRAIDVTHDRLRQLWDKDEPVLCRDCALSLMRHAKRPVPYRNRGRFTKAELVLSVLASLEARRVPMPVSVPYLVIECWRAFPEKFGLRGYDAPSDNSVIVELVRLKKDELVYRPRPLHYSMTESGRARAAKLTAKSA